ncbi:MAG: carboxypeptidase-like regulatory domain-containing protein [Paludibacteraceae bacterium]|nr:carboxypeptidase-like regulatory domain-containing protein [Paludibacteraceae bacterium]
MKQKLMHLGAVLAVFFSVSSCTDSKNASDVDAEAADYVMSESIKEEALVGMVADPNGAPLSGVLVVTGADSAFTSSNGLYSLERKRCVNGRSVVRFEKEGYFSVVRTADINQLDAVLQPVEDKDSVAAISRFKANEATSLKVGGMVVSIPANSLVNEKGEDYFGPVSASLFYLDPNAKDFQDAMPGGDLSGVTANGKEVALLSYGMVEVSLSDTAGGKLQLKPGAESELTFPVPNGFDDKLHNSIPLWYFDEDKGTWMEEGVAEKVNGCYKGKIKHFSWHNLDWPDVRATIEGYVRNQKGEPLGNIRVTVSQTSGYTDANGYYRVYVPKSTPVFVTVRPIDYGGKTNLPLYRVGGLKAGTVYKQDVVLPNAVCIKGRVTNTNGDGVFTIVSALPRSSARTNFRGDYKIYVSGDEPLTVTVLPENYINKDVKLNAKSYTIAGENDVNPDFSYDIVLPVRHYGYGLLADDRGSYLSGVKVTVNIDGVEFTDRSFLGYYSFYYLDAKKATVGVKSADYYGYKEKFYDVPCKNGLLSFPKIVMPIGQTIKGCVVNTCGPSMSKVTLLYGGVLSKKRESYTVNTDAFGNFKFFVPIDKKKEKKQIRIKCRNKQKKVKIKDSQDYLIDLGDIEMCSDFVMEDNCVYVETSDEILKFNLAKDRFNEMMKSNGNSVKRQIWCKSSGYAGFLVFSIDGDCKMQDRKVPMPGDTTFKINDISVYLVTPNITTFEGKTMPVYQKSSKEDFYSFSTDIYDKKGDEVFVFGNVNLGLALPVNNLDKFYYQYFGKIQDVDNLTYGNSNTQKFFTCKSPKGSAKSFEDALKKEKKMVEKGTFRDANNNVASVYASDDEQVLVRRFSKSKWEATVLFREGIGNDPLFQCWKVDFSRSSLRSKGSAPVEYMLRNEADIINMVMFGPIMGIKFEKTNISDNKCGCSTPAAVVPAN